MEIIIALVWTLGAILTLRHVGYAANQSLLSGKSHEFQRICHSCRCSGCGQDAWDHYSNNPCRESEWTGLHVFEVSMMGLLCLAVWPVFVIWYATSSTLKRALPSSSFFAPAPKFLTKQEKADKRIAELEASLASAEAEGARLIAAQKKIYEGA